jgi:hypothetical protein
MSACDKSSDNSSTPPPTTSPVKVPIELKHPTTQQLENTATWKVIDLKVVPLSLSVPQSWDKKTLDINADLPQVFLEGPTPSDEIRIRIPASRIITAEQETLLEADANKQLQKNPDLFAGSVVRDITGGKVIEQLTVSEVPAPSPDELKDMKYASTQPVQLVRWTFTVCVPSGKGFNAYDLTAGLPMSQFKADSAFLRSIFAGLKFEPTDLIGQ